MLARYLRSVLSDYGMLLVLLLLCAACGIATIADQQPIDSWTADRLAGQIAAEFPGQNALVVGVDSDDEKAFVALVRAGLQRREVQVLDAVNGDAVAAGQALERAAAAKQKVAVVASSLAASQWLVYDAKRRKHPELAELRLVAPRVYRWPTFLMAGNLRNVMDQAAVIAIIAVGMTMVIVSGGIDLSVGSLMACASVITALLIQRLSGGSGASWWIMALGALLAIAACAGAGGLTGSLVTRLHVPPFIVTLSLMMIASGLAFILSNLQTIPVPEAFKQIGHGKWLGVPIPVIIMLALYFAAHLVMTRTVFGRHLYAVGGNERAAQLCGIAVATVRTWAYVLCGALAGLGGVIETSIYGSGDPKTGGQYELFVISAVVVGGASLSGGEGKIFNTLIGSLILAVIRNAMNLANLESNRQRVVLGLVILGAVVLDRVKRKG